MIEWIIIVTLILSQLTRITQNRGYFDLIPFICHKVIMMSEQTTGVKQMYMKAMDSCYYGKRRFILAA